MNEDARDLIELSTGKSMEGLRAVNTLEDLVNGVASRFQYSPQTVSTPFPFIDNVSYTPFSLNRIALSYGYMMQGIVQRFVDQPIDDAFRGGFKIKSDQLSADDVKALLAEVTRNRNQPTARQFAKFPILSSKAYWQSGNSFGQSDVTTVIRTCKWARLFGGAGLIINTDQDPRQPLNIRAITEGSPLEFIDADRWELILATSQIWDTSNPVPFSYYGLGINRSRVIPILGKDAPSYVRLRLQGWGMSVLESCIRQINTFLKFEDLIFEILDQAKIEVWKIQRFNDLIGSRDGQRAMVDRLTYAAQLKNYVKAVALDADDDFQFKNPTWAGLSDLWYEIRLNLAASLNFPMNKLFGESAAGFSSGQDSIENYNSIIGAVRQEDAEPILRQVIDLRAWQMFGVIPDYDIEWPALKELNGVEEQAVKDAIQNRVLARFDRGLLTGEEAEQELIQEAVTESVSEVAQGTRDVAPMEGGDQQDPGNRKLTAGDKAKEKRENAAAMRREFMAARTAHRAPRKATRFVSAAARAA